MVERICFCILCIHLLQVANAQQAQGDGEYRAAKYHITVDNSFIFDVVPGVLPPTTAAYRYFIEYGDSMIIVIDDIAGPNLVPNTIVIWDRLTDLCHSTIIRHDVQKFYKGVDSVEYSVGKQYDEFVDLCKPDLISDMMCDSVLAVGMHGKEREFMVYFDRQYQNLRFADLCYPQLPYLPKSIVRQDVSSIKWFLLEVIHGQERIDELIQEFNYDGYEQISEEEMNSLEILIPEDVIHQIENGKN